MAIDEILDDQESQSDQGDLYEHHRFVVDMGQEPLRIDKFLLNRLEKVSRNKIQNAAKAECIFVNDKPVKQNHKVKPGDTITILLTTPAREYKTEAEDIPLEIVYEDNDLVVLNKPAGLVVHPGSGNYTGTLVNGLLHHFKNLPDMGDDSRPGLVHRLDKNTTGLMVIAKSDHAMTHLSKQFFDRTIKRRYVALVWGDFEEDEGTVDAYIGRDQRHRKKMSVYPEGDFGKMAITHYKVIERFGYCTLLECRLETGRTHQIRVHLSYLHHPVFNDDTYGGDRIVKGTVFTKYKQFIDNCFAILPRHALHARLLGFKHPTTNEYMEFEAPLPQEFQMLVEKWQNYFQHRLLK